MLVLSSHQQALHDEALEICTRLKHDEGMLIEVLQKIDHAKLYKKFQRSSLFKYAVHELKLSEPVAYGFISVARKAKEIPGLKAAIQGGRLSVSKASRIVSALTPQNAAGLVDFAIKHSWEKINHEVARVAPKSRAQDKVKFVSEDLVQVTVTISKTAFDNLKCAEALATQKGKKLAGRGDVVEIALREYVERHDPVRKAKRAAARKVTMDEKKKTFSTSKQALVSNMPEGGNLKFPISISTAEVPKEPKLCVHRVLRSERVKLTAEQKHVVFNRDQGRCTHTNIEGERCGNDRYLHVHHIIPVSHGGGNEPDNLTTLCSSHHDLVHQLSLPLDNQVTWLRSPTARYLA